MTTKKNNPAIILLGICVLIAILNIDYTSVNLAIVDISIETNSPLSTLQWMLSGYVLAWAATVVPFGKMADAYGKRRLLLIGVWVFMISSAMIGLGTEAWHLILGRLFQGIGGALFVPPCYALIFENFPKERQGFAIGTIGAAAGIGLAFGPSLAGLILEYFSWRWLFYINIPLGIFVILSILYSAKKEPISKKGDVNYKLSSILGLATVCLFYGLDHTNYSSTAFDISIFLYPAVFLIIAFILLNNRSKQPLLPSTIVKNSAYWGITLGFFSHQFTFSITFFLSNLYLQNTKGFDAFTTGQIFIALTIALGILSALGGKMVDRFGIKMPATIALFIMAISCLLFLNFNLDTSLIYILSILFIMGLGMGLALAPYNTGVMQVVDADSITTATSFFTMSNLIAHTAAIIFATNFITEFGKMKLNHLIRTEMPLADTSQIAFMNLALEKTDRSIENYNAFSSDIAQSMFRLVESSFLHSMHFLFIICSILCFISVFLSIKYLPKK